MLRALRQGSCDVAEFAGLHLRRLSLKPCACGPAKRQFTGDVRRQIDRHVDVFQIQNGQDPLARVLRD
jgi:hypothetical protein